MYLSSSYTRDLTDDLEALDTLTAATGVRCQVLPQTAFNIEYSVNSYSLDRDAWGWPRDWSTLFYISQGFAVATPPTYGSIEGMVFEDQNVNGKWDGGEPVLDEVSVRLGERRTTTTNERGRFFFSRVVPGAQTLQVDVGGLDPEWMAQEPQASVQVRRSRATRLQLPVIQGGRVRGAVFIDEDADGLFDPAEEPLEGVAVILLPREQFRRTDADGAFEFDPVAPDTYTLIVHTPDIPNGYELDSDPAVSVQVKPGQTRDDIEFAVRRLAVETQF
jgi:hypothetical protein